MLWITFYFRLKQKHYTDINYENNLHNNIQKLYILKLLNIQKLYILKLLNIQILRICLVIFYLGAKRHCENNLFRTSTFSWGSSVIKLLGFMQ